MWGSLPFERLFGGALTRLDRLLCLHGHGGTPERLCNQLEDGVFWVHLFFIRKQRNTVTCIEDFTRKNKSSVVEQAPCSVSLHAFIASQGQTHLDLSL